MQFEASLPVQPCRSSCSSCRRGEATAYFVFMEAVANAQKHAGASMIRVRASSSPRELRIEVADDGIGGAAEGAGSGLRGLRQRVEDVGGSFSVESTLARGTLIVAAIPLDSMESS